MRRTIALLLLVGLTSCRCGGSTEETTPDGGTPDDAQTGEDAAVAEPGETPDDESEDDDASAPDDGDGGPGAKASTRFRDATPGIDGDRSGPLDAACIGGELLFASVVVDERCASDLAHAKKLRARLEKSGGAAGLRQEASVAGTRVTVRLVNGAASPMTLPLSFHGKLPAFAVLAEDERHTIYELASPALELRDPGQGNRAHFARIQLAPGGVASATVTVVNAITKVLGRGPSDPCRGAEAGTEDGGACSPTRLAKGRYVLHIGELLTDVEAGLPASVPFQVR